MSTKKINLLFNGLCLFVIAVLGQLAMNIPLVVDEFQVVSHTFDAMSRTPYLDFPPYKNVLGYYLIGPILSFLGWGWNSLLATKLLVTIFSVFGVFFLAFRLNKSRSLGFLLAIVVLFAPTFMAHSSHIRMDLFMGIVGSLNLLFLKENKFKISGVLLGLAFLISQKAIIFVLCSFVYVVARLFFKQKDSFKEFIQFAVASFLMVFFYSIFWILFSGFDNFISAFVHGPVRAATIDVYGDVRWRFWGWMISESWAIFILAFLSSVIYAYDLFSKRSIRSSAPAILAFVVFLALLMQYRTPWSYTSLIFMPCMLFLFSAAFQVDIVQRSKKIFYSFIVILVSINFLLTGVDYFRVSNIDQKKSYELGLKLLDSNNADYYSSFYLYGDRSKESVNILRWLDAKRLRTIGQFSSEQLKEIVEEWRDSNIKFISDRGRVLRLPKVITSFLQENYSRLHGNILIYSPTIKAGSSSFLKFSGKYQVYSADKKDIKFNNKKLKHGEIAHLDSGEINLKSSGLVRLKLIPELSEEEVLAYDSMSSYNLFLVHPRKYKLLIAN
ncbi:MAG: hypothetical protein AB8E15_09840 [Bdellovibrionales bacterium]